MLYKNLTVEELFETIWATEDVVELFEKGLRRGNDKLAGSAMEELIRRGDTESIIKALDDFYAEDGGKRISETSAALLVLMRDLADICRQEDAILSIYAGTAPHPYGPTEWFRQRTAERSKKAHHHSEENPKRMKQYLML